MSTIICFKTSKSFHFHLCSHAGVGTVNPTFYQVLHDDNNLTLQNVTAMTNAFTMDSKRCERRYVTIVFYCNLIKTFFTKKNGPRCWKTNIFQHFWARACSIGFSSCRARHGPLERRPGQARGGPWWPRSSGVSGHWWKQDQDALPIYQRKFLHLKIFVPFKPRATVNLCYLPFTFTAICSFFSRRFQKYIGSLWLLRLFD